MPAKITPPGYHIVEQGDWLSKLAAWYGLPDYLEIWNHENNTALCNAREHPSVLLPGDNVFIPAIEIKTVAVPTETRARFKLVRRKILVALIIKDIDDEPIAGRKYRLYIQSPNGEQLFAGVTDSDGSLQHKIPAIAEQGRLYLDGMDNPWNLALGNLDPLHHKTDRTGIVSGALGRLQNLGYLTTEASDELDDDSIEAVRQFQMTAMKRKNADGSLDKATYDAIRERHGF